MFNPVHHHCHPFMDFYKGLTCAEPRPLLIVRKSDTPIFWRACLLVVPAGLDPRTYSIGTLHNYSKLEKGWSAQSVRTFARKNQTNCDELVTLEFIPPKYREYNDVFEELERGFPLPKHSEDDHEIVLEAPEKLATGFNYNTNEKETKIFQVYIKKISEKVTSNNRSQKYPNPLCSFRKKPGN